MKSLHLLGGPKYLPLLGRGAIDALSCSPPGPNTGHSKATSIQSPPSHASLTKIHFNMLLQCSRFPFCLPKQTFLIADMHYVARPSQLSLVSLSIRSSALVMHSLSTLFPLRLKDKFQGKYAETCWVTTPNSHAIRPCGILCHCSTSKRCT
jgi:hypothetical protein